MDRDETLEARLADAERERDAARYERDEARAEFAAFKKDMYERGTAPEAYWQERAEVMEADRDEANAEAAALWEALGIISQRVIPENAMTAVDVLLKRDPSPAVARMLAAVEVAELDMEYDGARAQTAATAKQGDLDKWRALAARLRDAKARFRELNGGG